MLGWVKGASAVDHGRIPIPRTAPAANKPTKVMRTGTSLFAILAAAAGGYVVGLLTAPRTGAETRERLTKEAGVQTQKAEAQLRRLERKLKDLEATIADRAQTLRKEAGDAVDDVLHGIEVGDGWNATDEDISEDLTRMPRK